MKYSPKKQNNNARWVYSLCLLLSLICMLIKPQGGATGSILSSIALVSLAASIYLFVRYDSTKYEYILIERNGTFDFYVNKVVGRRGTYVVYFPLTDCVAHGQYKDEMSTEIKNKYSNCRLHKYIQSFMPSSGLYYMVFRINSSYEAIVFEPSDEMISMISSYAGRLPTKDDDDDEPIEITIQDESE